MILPRDALIAKSTKTALDREHEQQRHCRPGMPQRDVQPNPQRDECRAQPCGLAQDVQQARVERITR